MSTDTKSANPILEKAIELSWPKGTEKAKYAYKTGKATRAFRTALHKVFPQYKYWDKAPATGASCDVAVATVVRSTGLAKKYPNTCAKQFNYKPKNFVRKVYYNVRPIDVMKPGDIVIYEKTSGARHHTLILGEKCIYEASYARYFFHVNKSLKKIRTKYPKVVVFRVKEKVR